MLLFCICVKLNSRPSTQVADSCLPPTQHTVEYKALKFGDQLDSHVLVPLQSRTFKKNFEVSFEFRTYYPNGLFFIASVSYGVSLIMNFVNTSTEYK